MANMHPHANANGGNIILGFGILTFVASVANILRFWARRLIHLKPGLDDYLSALLLLFNYGLLVITIFSVVLGGLGAGSYGLGEEERVEEIANLFKCFYVFCFIFGAAETLAKVCVLAFYHRIFPTVFMRRCCIILGVTSLLHGGSLLIINAICGAGVTSYDYKGWSLGRSIDISLFNAVMSVPDAVIDVLILCLPIRELVRLQTTRARKAAIFGVFMMGGLSIVASVGRIKANLDWYLHGPRQALTGPWAAALIEVGSATIAACLPTLPPVWHRLRRGNMNKLRINLGSGPPTPQVTKPRGSDSFPGRGGPPPESVLTIGRISLKGRRAAAAESCLFMGTEMEELDRLGMMESPEPVVVAAGNPRLSPDWRRDDDDAQRSQSVQSSRRNIEGGGRCQTC